MFHFDHPQILEDQFHGWQGEGMVAKFAEYARFLFNEYSSKVKLWNTVNEPNMYCTYFPSAFMHAGLYSKDDVNHFQCVHHVVLAHAAAYKAFHDDGHTGGARTGSTDQDSLLRDITDACLSSRSGRHQRAHDTRQGQHDPSRGRLRRGRLEPDVPRAGSAPRCLRRLPRGADAVWTRAPSSANATAWAFSNLNPSCVAVGEGIRQGKDDRVHARTEGAPAK